MAAAGHDAEERRHWFWMKFMASACLALFVLTLPAAIAVASRLASIESRLTSFDRRIDKIEDREWDRTNHEKEPH